MSGPERRKAFSKALADCGSVSRCPMAQVNIGQETRCPIATPCGGRPRAAHESMVSANIGTIRRSRRAAWICGLRQARCERLGEGGARKATVPPQQGDTFVAKATALAHKVTLLGPKATVRAVVHAPPSAEGHTSCRRNRAQRRGNPRESGTVTAAQKRAFASGSGELVGRSPTHRGMPEPARRSSGKRRARRNRPGSGG